MQTSFKHLQPMPPPEILVPGVSSEGGVGAFHGSPFYGPSGEESVSYLALLRRHRLAVALILLACVAGGLLYATLAPKSYKAQTVLEVTGINHDFMNSRDVDPDAANGTSDSYLETQIALLQNESVVDRVVAVMAPLVPAKLAKAPGQGEALVRGMLAGVKAKEEGQSDLVRITLTGPDPKLVAKTTNELTTQYIQGGEDARLAAVTATGSFLKQQLADAKSKLQNSEDALQQYARASGIVLTDDTHESVAAEHLREIQQGLAQAEVDRANRESQAEMTEHTSAERLPQVIDDPTVREDMAKLTDLKRQLADASTTMTPANYRVQKLQSQIGELEAEIARQRAVIVSQLTVADRIAVRRQQLLRQQYNENLALVTDQGTKQVRYNMLKHEADVNRLVYQSMLQRVREAGVMAALRAPSARVVSPAKVPLLPDSPKLGVCGLLSLVLGAVLSLLYILVAERKDNSVRNPGESGQHVECPELAVIPRARLAAKAEAGAKKGVLRPALDAGDGKGSSLHPALTHWRQADKTFMAEAYRSAVTSILFSRRGGVAPKVLLVTSPQPQCGKTTTIANLAVSLAEGGRRVLLIDGDLRRPALPQFFDLHETEGLADALDETERVDAKSLMRPTGYPGLTLLASGKVRGSVAKMLHSSRMAGVIESARREFDFVLIDAPPLLGLADARLLGKFADGLILVCRAGRTNVDDLNEARRILDEDGTYILGTILNDYNLQRERSSHYSSYLTYVGPS